MVCAQDITEQRSLMAHLTRRIAFGATQAELDKLETQNYEDVVDDLLDPGESNHLPDELSFDIILRCMSNV